MINLADIKDSKEKFDNRYRLIEKIGGGGFSEVWLAHDTNADIDVALKIYTPNGELDEEGKEDFKKEFARLCGLNHSNIIHAIGFGIHNEELPYLAMSVCKNGSAKKLIGHVEEGQLWVFIEQVALGLQYLHAHSITHQDIKPDNVLINSDGQFLIIDFGISTKTRNTLRKSNKGTVGEGTPWYMSVESWGTESPNIHARDIWAFGATLYEIITGDVPFGQYGGVTQKAQNGKIPLITNDISAELKQLVYDCLSLNAWDRPDANEIVKRAQNHKEGIQPAKHNKIIKRAAFCVAVITFTGFCYFGYEYFIKPYFIKSYIDNAEVNKEKMALLRRNDSIFLDNVDCAVTMIEAERIKIKTKKDTSAIDETVLCNAAKMYKEAIQSQPSDSAKKQGEQKWTASQQIIDDTYEYLYNKSVRYFEAEAYGASQKFEKRFTRLNDYITPSIRTIRKKSKSPSITRHSKQETRSDSLRHTDNNIIDNETSNITITHSEDFYHQY